MPANQIWNKLFKKKERKKENCCQLTKIDGVLFLPFQDKFLTEASKMVWKHSCLIFPGQAIRNRRILYCLNYELINSIYLCFLH